MEKKNDEQLVLAKQELARIARSPDPVFEIARTLGDVYDVELPIPEVITAIFRTERADVGEHIYYMAPEVADKKVLTLTSNCTVTQVKVSPRTRTEVTWTDLVSEEYYVCIPDLLKADHNVLEFFGDSIIEAMDRQEVYAVLQLVAAGAVAQSNVYTLDSGKEKFDYPKLVEMARSVAKYGRNLVLITGADVTTDITLMNYDADKNQPVNLESAGVKTWIPVEECTVDVDASTKTVIAADRAYLVAVSDSKNNKPGIFVRRKTATLASTASDTTAISKERIAIVSGNMINVSSTRKLAKAIAGFEEYSGTLINAFTVAQFTRS